MPKMLIVDTYYPDAMAAMACALRPPQIAYDSVLKCVLDFQFGTADFYSRHLRSFGWEVMDVIANFPSLQAMWAAENGATGTNVLQQQINDYKPDVIFMQDLGYCGGPWLSQLAKDYLLVGQSSCAIRRELIPNFKVIFTSFPHYVQKYRNQPYCKFVYNPLAFEPSVLGPQPERDLNITFVGGVGAPSHWAYGMRVLEAVAAEFPAQFDWWGYGGTSLAEDSPLRRCYRGYAWGRDMYRIYQRSKIVVNRHGEIAGEYANNMRMYEATGCGALLMTESKANLRELFEADEVIMYDSLQHLLARLHYALDPEHTIEREAIAKNGMYRTLRDHTYRERMKTVSDTLLELLP